MDMHHYKPEFSRSSCESWFENLQQRNYLVFENGEYKLTTPFELVVPLKEAAKITSTYIDNEESGGLLMCEMLFDNDKLILFIREHHPIPNVVEKYFKNSSRRNSYYADPDKYRQVLSDNFSKSDPRKILFPIHYHTHPTADINEDRKYFTTIRQLRLSEGDISVCMNRKIKFDQCNLIYLNAILTGNVLEHRIIFYGKGASPIDFQKSMEKQSRQGIIDATQNIENDWLRLFAQLGFLVGTAVVAVHDINKGEDLLHTFGDYANRKEYCSVISKVSATRVVFPKYNPEE